MNLAPVVVKFRPAWKRRDYRRLSRRPAPLYIPYQLLDQAPPVLELDEPAAEPEPVTEPVRPLWLTRPGGEQ